MTETTSTEKVGSLPPRWVVTTFWVGHRFLYRITGGRFGLRRPTPDQWGMLRIHTIGRKSGAKRVAILGYYEDGPNLVTMAMNGWGDAEPAWWLNLRSNPDVMIETRDGRRQVHARAAAQGQERDRLWKRWGHYDGEAALDSWASRRSRQTQVVILEPRDHKP